MTSKRKFVAFFLGLFLGPIGYFYLGWRHVIMTFITLSIFVFIFGLINIPIFEWTRYVTLPVMGYCAYHTAIKINLFVEQEEIDNSLDLSVLRSFSFASYQASGLLQSLAISYSFVVCIYASIRAFDENVLLAAFFLFIGTPFIVWIIYMLFGFIATLLEVPFERRISKEMDKD